LCTAQERADLAELLERAVAAGRHGGAARGFQLLDRLSGLGGLALQRGQNAVGVEDAGQQVVDRDVARSQARLARQPATKP
jgi:hypothetical protein